MKPPIEGEVAAGYEPVTEAFGQALADSKGSADCCVHVDGDCVVDLRRGRTADQLQCVFSATKGAVAACANLLIERGLLDPGSPVIRYWPEFGAHGKNEVTVRDLLEHRSGVLAPDAVLSVEQVGDWDSVCVALADATPAWEPGTAYGYHAQSFGWLVGELVRRVDGRGLVEFFISEVAGPSGADILLGLPASEDERLLDVEPVGLEPETGADNADEIDLSQFVGPHTESASTLGGVLPSDAFAVQADSRLRRLPMAASNGYSNARGLSRLYAWLLTELSSQTQRQLTSAGTSGPDVVLSSPAFDIEQHFSRGFEVIETAGGHAAFGHSGLGGITAFADPSHRLAFAFTSTDAVLGPPGTDARAQVIIDSVYTSPGDLGD